MASLVQVLKDCGNARDLRRGKAIHSEAIQSGGAADILVATTLVSMYSKCGSMADARKVFDAMPSRNFVSWIVLALGYARNREFDLALGFFHQIDPLIATSSIDRSTLLAVIAACRDLAAKGQGCDGFKRRCLEKAMKIHRLALRNGLERDLVVASNLVDMYVRCGSLVDALGVFLRIPCNNVVSWTAMILGYVQAGEFGIALEMFARMQLEGCHPVARTFVAAIKACSGLAEEEGLKRKAGEVIVRKGAIEKGRLIHSQAASRGCDQVMFVAGALLEMFLKCGSVEDGRRVFDGIPRNNVVSWTTLMMGYVQVGKAEMALELFSQMQQEGCAPDGKCFMAALQAIACLAAVDDADEGRNKVAKRVLLSKA